LNGISRGRLAQILKGEELLRQARRHDLTINEESIMASRVRCGLLALATAALLMPSVRGTPAARHGAVDRAQSQDLQEPAAKAGNDERALKEFLEIYRLAPGQNLKRVEPPRPDGIRAFMNRTHPGFANRADEFAAMTFRWSDPDRLVRWAMTTSDAGYYLRDLPRYFEMGIYPAEIEGDPELLKQTVTGDWIYRVGVPDEQMVVALESILQRTLRMRITMKFREVDRDVVVVRGRYHYSPLAGRSKNQVEIYAKQVIPGGGGAGGGSGKFPEFLKWVGDWIERPVVSEVEAPPQGGIEWFYNARSPFTEQMRREDHDEAQVLRHLQEQTGLTFTREKKSIRVLFVERAK
jgi:hypothetical protein